MMKFEKRNFMGIELDVLVGHPEHELLFVATHVARAAGLKNPKNSAQMYKLNDGAMQLKSLVSLEVPGKGTFDKAHEIGGRRWKDMWMFTEPLVYQMLLRGHSPQAEPFRKWVTEEVLPTIRKTGSYNAADSQNPIAQGIMDRLMSLEGVVLKQTVLIEQMQEALCKFAHREVAPEPATVSSPYEGQSMVALHDPAGFNEKTYRELAESRMPLTAVAKLKPRVLLNLEVTLGALWDEQDTRKLKERVSVERRKWKLYPREWLAKTLTRTLYAQAIQAVVDEKLSA